MSILAEGVRVATGLTPRQLDYLCGERVVRSRRPKNRSGVPRVFSARDLQVAKVCERLLDRGVSVKRLREVARVLYAHPHPTGCAVVLSSAGSTRCLTLDELVEAIHVDVLTVMLVP